MRKLLKIIGIIVLVIILLAAGLIGYLSLTEFKPEPVEDAEYRVSANDSGTLSVDQDLTILTWNIGYCGLDQSADFFMDGGSNVYPTSQEHVDENLESVRTYLESSDADMILLQEVDRDSARSGRVDQLEAIAGNDIGYAYATNYRCAFVPFPMPPIGKVDSGIVTLFNNTVSGTPTRVNLPCPFSWPVRTANLKRGMLITRFPMSDGHELVLINFHLEAYDDGEGKAAQTELLINTIQEEYDQGNYVIAGGDFNQTFPGGLEQYPVQGEDLWAPGTLTNDDLPEGWTYAYDLSTPTCRSLDRPLDTSDPTMQYYIIDGFIVSPNITISSVTTQDLGFTNSDHNPVRLEINLSE